MKRSFRYLLLNDCYALVPILIFAAVIAGGNFLMGGQTEGQHFLSSLFVTYLNAWPLMCGLIVGLLCTTTYSNYIGIALSLGARRRDFFWANQLNFLLYLGCVWATQLALDLFSAHFGWESMELWGITAPSRNPTLIPVMLLLMTGGSCLGILSVRKPKLAIFVTVVASLLFVAVLLAAFFIGGSQRSGLWGSLSWLIPTVSAVLALVFDGILWHFSQKIVVR